MKIFVTLLRLFTSPTAFWDYQNSAYNNDRSIWLSYVSLISLLPLVGLFFVDRAFLFEGSEELDAGISLSLLALAAVLSYVVVFIKVFLVAFAIRKIASIFEYALVHLHALRLAAFSVTVELVVATILVALWPSSDLINFFGSSLAPIAYLWINIPYVERIPVSGKLILAVIAPLTPLLVGLLCFAPIALSIWIITGLL